MSRASHLAIFIALSLSLKISSPVCAIENAASLEQQCRLNWFRYDHDLPLNASLSPLDTTPTGVRYSLTYESVHDQRVTAILAMPLPSKFTAPYPAVLLLHGSGGNKDSSYIKASAELLNSVGYAALSIDSQYAGARKRPDRSNDIFLPNSYTERDAWVQTVIDLRRAVDYLQTRKDINSHRLGYLGFSQGAMVGSVFGGVEKRVGVFCLAVPGGALLQVIKHIDRYPVLKAQWPIKITPEVMKIVRNVTQITDPIHYIGGISPRPLFIITAKYDEIIPAESSAALIKAARIDPKLVVKQINSGHILNPEVIFTIREWFQKELGSVKSVQG